MRKYHRRLAFALILGTAACGRKTAQDTTQQATPTPPAAAAAVSIPDAPAVAAAPAPPVQTLVAAPVPRGAPLPPQMATQQPPIQQQPDTVASASTAGGVPSVESSDPRLAVSGARWGAGMRTLEFDVTYTGTSPSADCDYRLFDSAGNQSGMTGSFSVQANESSTQSITLADDVTLVRVSLRQ